MSIQEIKKALVGTFQGILKNIVSLANDSTLEKDFKTLKVGDKNTPIQLKENQVKISDLDTNALTLNGIDVVTGTVAGQILGYTRIANDGTGSADAYIAMDETLTVLQTVDASTNVSITFVAPPSGNVEIQFSCSLYASSKAVEFALSDNATYNEISETHTYDAAVQSSDETDVNMTVVSWAVTGLTAGTSYTYYIASAENPTSGTAFIRHGRFRVTGMHYPPIIVKAIALPASIITGG